MRKVRKKLTDAEGITRLRSVWECRCKIGTTASTIAYCFEQPELNKPVWVVEWKPHSIVYDKPMQVIPDRFHDDGFFFCYKI